MRRRRSIPIAVARRHAGGQSLDCPDRSQRTQFGRIAYDVPIGIDGIRIGGSAFHSDVSPGDDRRQFDERTRTDNVEFAAASFR